MQVGQRLSCAEYFVKKMPWMQNTHEKELGAVGVIMCPKSTCGEQLGIWGNVLKCTCDKDVTPAFLVYKSKFRKGFRD